MEGKKKQYKPKNSHKDEEEKQVKKYQPKRQLKQSDEEGFTGSPDEWFDDIAFKKQMCADLSYNNQNHDYYFGSYSHFYIHEEMLKDKVRTDAYMNAIERNKADFKDKVVLDIGAGTGILSIFAARSGAKKVYAIENAEIAYFAQEIIKQNKLDKIIEIKKGKMEEIELPEKVDIIISEWMGYFLLYESMLDTVMFARDKYLKKGGKLLPDRCKIYLAALEDGNYKAQKIGFWKNVYGVDMSCLSNAAIKEPLVDSCDYQNIVSNDCKILDLDLVKMDKGEVEFSTDYELTIKRDEKVHALISWFDCDFSDLQNPITLSTSPYKDYTHWKQVVFYLDQDIQAKKGEVLKGSIAVRKSRTNFRELDIKISYHFEGALCKKHFVQLYKLR